MQGKDKTEIGQLLKKHHKSTVKLWQSTNVRQGVQEKNNSLLCCILSCHDQLHLIFLLLPFVMCRSDSNIMTLKIRFNSWPQVCEHLLSTALQAHFLVSKTWRWAVIAILLETPVSLLLSFCSVVAVFTTVCLWTVESEDETPLTDRTTLLTILFA